MVPYYDHSGITIYHGDCRDVLASLSDIAIVVTSPPYNQMAHMDRPSSGMWNQISGGAGFQRAWRKSGYRDDMPEPDYQEWQNDIFGEIGKICRDDASLFYNHQVRWREGACLHPVIWFHPDGWAMRQEIVWNRGGGMMFNARMFVRFDERILWFVHGSTWTWNQSHVGYGTIWNVAREQQQQGKLHPVAFPVELPSRCIAAASKTGDTVLDPFMGSGTTLRAAKDMGRRAIGIEIEERYCEIAAKRMAQECLFMEDG